jgi:hypothetical protein
MCTVFVYITCVHIIYVYIIYVYIIYVYIIYVYITYQVMCIYEYITCVHYLCVTVPTLYTNHITSPWPAVAPVPDTLDVSPTAESDSLGTTRTSGAAEEEEDLDGPEAESPPSLFSCLLAASRIMNAFLGEVNWPCRIGREGKC